ncbi:MAG: FAD-dependent oxidoreductase, partial [Sphingomonadales bacterium]|nr:FAD-dependent oxidoreductase [Sphingomonadales bacterium]
MSSDLHHCQSSVPLERIRLVLAGGGHSHLAVLEDWSRGAPPGTERILITPHRHFAYSGMLPGWVEGLYSRQELLIDLAPLAEAAGAQLVLDEVVELNAQDNRLLLASGSQLEFDTLSLATGGSVDYSMFSALGDRLTPIRPIGQFMKSWEEIRPRLAEGSGASVVVVGGGAAGVELALAISASSQNDIDISLVVGTAGLLDTHHPAVRKRVRTTFADRGIPIFEADAVGEIGGLCLSDGRHLPAELVIAATGSVPPTWLDESGLRLGPTGGVAIGPEMRSLSHSRIFAAGDVSE